MAKEQVHNYLRTGIILAGIVFAGGGYAMKIKAMDGDVVQNEADIRATNEKVSSVKEDVHRLELNAKDTQALAETAVRNAAESKDMFGKVMEHLEQKARDDTAMQIKMGKIEVKVDTLIKGD